MQATPTARCSSWSATATDPGTQAVADPGRPVPDRIEVIVYSASPKSKPKALNAALQHCGGEITGIFDAEDDVHPALLRRVDQAFGATEADVVQAGVQLMNFRSHLLFTVHNVLEYYFWFRSRLQSMPGSGSFRLAATRYSSGTARAEVFGGWYELLTKDCEIGVRPQHSWALTTAVFYDPSWSRGKSARRPFGTSSSSAPGGTRASCRPSAAATGGGCRCGNGHWAPTSCPTRTSWRCHG